MSEFKCSGCRKTHTYHAYAVAQLTQGNTLTFTGCECGKTTTLTPAKYRKAREKMRERREATDQWCHGYSMRTYNSAGVFMKRHRPDTTDPDGEAAEKELRDLGTRINTVRGQKSWRSDLYRDCQRIATCRNGKWVEIKTAIEGAAP